MTHTNRQVTNTDPSARMQSAADFAISFDWLEFTICDSSLTAVFEQVLQLPAGQFMHTGPGNYGYLDKHVHVHNKYVVVLSGGTAEQGIHVQLSGQGCAYLLNHLPVQQLIHNVLQANGRFTRVDLALDDKECVWYSIQQLLRHIRSKEIVSRWKEVTTDISQLLHNNAACKEIIYFGSSRSDFSLRIYNKTLEQRKSLITPEDIAALPSHWVRWEFTCRRKRAQALIQEIMTQQFAMGQVFADLLCGSMRIVRSDGTDSNRSRWPNRHKWQKFIGAAQPLRLYVPAQQNNLTRTAAWLKKYIVPTLAALLETKDGFARLLDMLSDGKHMVKKHQWVQVAAYNERVKNDDTILNVVQSDSMDYTVSLLDKLLLRAPVDRPWAIPL